MFAIRQTFCCGYCAEGCLDLITISVPERGLSLAITCDFAIALSGSVFSRSGVAVFRGGIIFVVKALCTAGPTLGLLRRFSEQASAAALVQWVVASRFRVLNVLGIGLLASFCTVSSLFSFIYYLFCPKPNEIRQDLFAI